MIIEKPNDLYCTPPDMIDDLQSTYGPFFMDACCNPDNCIVPVQKDYMNNKKDVGLEYDYLGTDPRQWFDYLYEGKMTLVNHPTIFMNPPYSAPELFIQKAWNDSEYFRVVMLVKSDGSTDWFNFPMEQPENEDNPMEFRHINPDWTRRQYFDITNRIIQKTRPKIAIVHIRKRIKFYYGGKPSKSSGTFASCLIILDRRKRPYDGNSVNKR